MTAEPSPIQGAVSGHRRNFICRFPEFVIVAERYDHDPRPGRAAFFITGEDEGCARRTVRYDLAKTDTAEESSGSDRARKT